MERFRIVKIETCGMKGIDKPVSIEFENQTISSSVFDKQSIKAVYGPNGSGKTSLIMSVDVYKNICLDSTYLYKESATLKKLINKKIRQFSFTVYFVGESKKAYCHSIVVDGSSDRPFIKSESLGIIAGRTINEDVKTVVNIENGKLVYFADTHREGQDKYDQVIKNAVNKLSEYRSIITLMSDRVFYSDATSLKGNLSENNVLTAMLKTYLFANDIVVYIANVDRQKETNWDDFSNYVADIQENLYLTNEPPKLFVASSSTIVPKHLYKWYEKQIEMTARFIKLFKEQLNSIRIIKTNYGDSFLCRLEMIYDDYSIDYEYESAGIKNLIEMFMCLEHTSKGGISFIDEMDVNINEIYLEKLFSYFMKYGKGQLCVTIHNTAPMKILKKGKHTIDFINSDQGVVSWIRNGAKNPTIDYKDGFIPGIPFNVNDFDFISIFEEN